MNQQPHFGPGDAPPPGDWRKYRKTAVSDMLKMNGDFTCTNREGESMQGRVGDYLVPDGYGGYYACGSEFHAKNYEEV